MNTALITTHLDVPNYGANLQAYTTKLFLEKNNIKPTYAILKSKSVEGRYERNVSKQQLKIHADFVKDNFATTQDFYNPSEFYSFVKNSKFDFHITGSDAVFRLSDNHTDDRWDLSYPNPFWLDCAVKNKISFSASAMGSNLPKIIKKGHFAEFKANLDTFKMVTVRDEWTFRCLAHLGFKAHICLDPVFLLRGLKDTQTDNKPDNKTSEYVVISLPKTTSRKFEVELRALFNRSGLNVIDIGTPESEKISNLDPIKWYELIANSVGYVGVRFHPLVVAISNQKPVFCLDMYARHNLERKKSKSYLLLKEFNLQDCYSDKLSQMFLTPKQIVRSILQQKVAAQHELDEKIDKTNQVYMECLR